MLLPGGNATIDSATGGNHTVFPDSRPPIQPFADEAPRRIARPEGGRMKTALKLCLALLLTLSLAGESTALVVALSNDDGWDSPGITAMKSALEGAGHSVTLAAPLDEQSGM